MKKSIPRFVMFFVVYIGAMACDAFGFEMPKNVEKALSEARLGESGGLWFTDSPKSNQAAEYHSTLSKWFTQNWAEIIKNYSAVVKTQRDRAALLEIAESLPPVDYIHYLECLLDEVPSGNIPESVIGSALSGSSIKNGFLAFNYSEPSVQALYSKAQKTLNPSSPLQAMIRDAQKGNLRSSAVMQREMNRQPLPETLYQQQESSLSKSALSGAQLPSAPKSPETKHTSIDEEPTSSTPWSVVAVLIVVAIGLLWLLLKRRS